MKFNSKSTVLSNKSREFADEKPIVAIVKKHIKKQKNVDSIAINVVHINRSPRPFRRRAQGQPKGWPLLYIGVF